MRLALLPLAICLFAPPAQAQQAGVVPASETGKLFTDLADQSTRLQPVLRQMKPNDWIKAGAPAAFLDLWEKTTKENLAIPDLAQSLAKKPENLSDSLSLLEHVHSVQESLSQLLPALEKYQNPALAELVEGMQSEGKSVRDAYSQRVLDLATDREQQFETADHEAQRCREILSKDPNAAKRVKSK